MFFVFFTSRVLAQDPIVSAAHGGSPEFVFQKGFKLIEMACGEKQKMHLDRPQDNSGLGRPYQDHLGGLDKAFIRTL